MNYFVNKFFLLRKIYVFIFNFRLVNNNWNFFNSFNFFYYILIYLNWLININRFFNFNYIFYLFYLRNFLN